MIETDRLILRMFREDDFDQHAEIAGDAEVVRYLGEGRPLARWEAWRQMAMILGHWQLRGYGPWAVEERETGKLLGRIGFFNPEGWPGFELGWVLAKSAWGRGFATEGAHAALRFAFEELQASRVISLIHPLNKRSIKVAMRIGESLEGRTQLQGKEALIYGIQRTQYLDRKL